MKTFPLLALLAASAAGPAAAYPLDPGQVRIVKVPGPDLPVVQVRAIVFSGSGDDPPGREGLASFTANLMRRGTETRRRGEIDEALDAAAGTLSVSVRKDTIVFAGQAPLQNFDAWYVIFRDVLLKPSFDPDEILKLRTDQKEAVEAVRRDDEALAREGLDLLLYRNHPYGHLAAGRIGSIDTISREEILAFHRTHFRKGNIAVGLAGAVTETAAERVRAEFAAFPDGQPSRGSRASTLLPRPRFLVIEKEGRGPVQIRIGHPISVTRAHADYFPLRVACAWLGEPGESIGRLDREIRYARGLAVTAAAAIESFAGEAGASDLPFPGLQRREEAFSMWVSPNSINAKFAIKIALAELQDLVKNGVPEEKLEEVKSIVSNHHAPGMETPERVLASALDEILDGNPGFDDRYATSVEAVTPDRVAAAAKKHLSLGRVGVVVVVPDAASFIERMLSAETPIEYPPGINRDATRGRDLEVVGMETGLRREDFEVVRAADLFR